MIFMGSKNRISKYIVPILQEYIDKNNIENYIEPFMGGCNIIDKIKCKNRTGYDISLPLVELFKKLQNDYHNIPDTISEEEYIKVKNNKLDYEDWYLGFVGFMGSFGARYFKGYARHNRYDKTEQIQKGSIKNFKKQYDSLKDCKFINDTYLNIRNISDSLIYCDPPYKGTTFYSKTPPINYEEYYNWVRELSKNNIVICSEYNMPDDFICI